MLEHVGYKNLAKFFDVVSSCLKPGGLALVHSITLGRTTTFASDKWTLKYIFPNGYLPSPSLMCLRSESKLVVEDVQNIGMDYYKTLKAWHANYKKSGVGDARGPVFDRMWQFYLMYCATGFRSKKYHLMQVVYSKQYHARYDAPR
jgi:cyclopropane-fatty-acyl-phospholipid synthase